MIFLDQQQYCLCFLQMLKNIYTFGINSIYFYRFCFSVNQLTKFNICKTHLKFDILIRSYMELTNGFSGQYIVLCY